MSNISFDFTSQTVIVNGAARSIGLEIARFFADSRTSVFLVDFDGTELEHAAASIGGNGIRADVTQTTDVDDVVARPGRR